jgi:hypothetical protein
MSVKNGIFGNPEGCWKLAGVQAERSPRSPVAKHHCAPAGRVERRIHSFRRPIRGGKRICAQTVAATASRLATG